MKTMYSKQALWVINENVVLLTNSCKLLMKMLSSYLTLWVANKNVVLIKNSVSWIVNPNAVHITDL